MTDNVPALWSLDSTEQTKYIINNKIHILESEIYNDKNKTGWCLYERRPF